MTKNKIIGYHKIPGYLGSKPTEVRSFRVYVKYILKRIRRYFKWK